MLFSPYDSLTPAPGLLFWMSTKCTVVLFCPMLCYWFVGFAAAGSQLDIGFWRFQHKHDIPGEFFLDTSWNRSKRWWGVFRGIHSPWFLSCRVDETPHCDEAGLCSLLQDELRISMMSVWVLMAGRPRANRLLIAASGSNLDTPCTRHL